MSITSASSKLSSQELGIASFTTLAPMIFPQIEAVESLSPLWLAAKIIALLGSSSFKAQYRAMAKASSAIQPSPKSFIASSVL